MYRTFAYTHFQKTAESMVNSGLSYVSKEQFLIQNPQKEYVLYPEISQLFNQTFPKTNFCFYKLIRYFKNEVISTDYKIAVEDNNFYETMRYTFYYKQRSYDVNGLNDDITAFFIKSVEDLPENRLLVVTNTTPFPNS